VLPEEKDVADILRRLQGLATESNLSIQRFTPQPVLPQPMYAAVPFKLQAEGTYHNLGAFFDRISRFPRIINISSISIKAKPQTGTSSSAATIVAECIATTFVLQTAPPAANPANPAPGK
jgi:type IV pilus assembly protein PilO